MEDAFSSPLVWGIWLCLCVLVAYWAHRKGRSAILFFIGSAVISPLIMAIVVAIVPGDESQMLANMKMKKCGQCAELVKKEAEVCRYCGNSFASARRN